MKTLFKKAALTAALSGALISTASADNHRHFEYDVTVTNLTYGINLTPVLVTSHNKNVSLYELGEPASDALEALAEGGATDPLATELINNARVADVQTSEGLLAPGASVTVRVKAKRGANRISLASMMLPTNDGFIALDSVPVPRRGVATHYSPGYDAGTEVNNELCASIPGPTCGGEGVSSTDGEGYVHINRGTHGIGDLAADQYDWRGSVAKITIERVHNRY